MTRVAIWDAGNYDQRYQHILTRFSDVMIVDSAEQSDAAIICTAINDRLDLIESVAKKTRYILCEVPFSASHGQVERAVELCQSQGAFLYPALPLRFAPVFGSVKQVLDDKKLGRLLSAKLAYQIRRPAGQSLIDYTVQAVDLVQWLLDSHIVEVETEQGRGMFHNDRSLLDALMLSATLENQAYATIDVSLCLPEIYPAPQSLKLEMIGTGGSVHIDAFRQNIDTYNQRITWNNWGSDELGELVRDFLACVQSGRSPSLSAADSLSAQRVALNVG